MVRVIWNLFLNTASHQATTALTSECTQVSIAEKIGCHLNVGPFIMGLVVLAAGTSIPDALSSIVVAKQGDGGMAPPHECLRNYIVLIDTATPYLDCDLIFLSRYGVR